MCVWKTRVQVVKEIDKDISISECKRKWIRFDKNGLLLII